MSLSARITSLAQAIGADIKALFTSIGSLSSLTTENKGSLVAAVNEVATYPGLTEQVHDIVSALLVEGTNVTLSYNDAAGTLTISSSGSGGGVTLAQVRKTISLGV